MRRRLITGFVLLDGLCALLAPAVAPALFAQSTTQGSYVEIAGMCVEEVRIEGADLAGRPVPMSFCTAS